ncbi:MAG: ArsR family transcriptional regulator [Candidatus Thorarchaeota archaeon]|nr:MAG: ArsR family transcriptional regulator [Candidatus Thorarchaeota archaeon]
MTKPKLLVALFGEPNTVERIAIRRRVDQLLLVFTRNQLEDAEYIMNKFSTLGIQIIPIMVTPSDFTNTLSSILRALDNQTLDKYQVEFSVTSGNTILTIAASVAAAIVKASILCNEENDIFEISEIWPAQLVNLTHKKREILSFLERFSSAVYQKDISKETGISQSSVSRHIHDLELARYVTRVRIARKKHVQITELGSTILHHKQIRKRRIWGSYPSQVAECIQTMG